MVVWIAGCVCVGSARARRAGSARPATVRSPTTLVNHLQEERSAPETVTASAVS